MRYYIRLTINRCTDDNELVEDGLFKQTFEINTVTFERAMECVSRLTHRYRPCLVTDLYTTLRKGENDNVRTDDCFQS